jgi:hypothetical protein
MQPRLPSSCTPATRSALRSAASAPQRILSSTGRALSTSSAGTEAAPLDFTGYYSLAKEHCWPLVRSVRSKMRAWGGEGRGWGLEGAAEDEPALSSHTHCSHFLSPPSAQLTAYGRCIEHNTEQLSKDVCKEQFVAMKQCVEQARAQRQR